ncbi:hypothetical protein H4582DRAFT_2073850 [Lactarius indigo]|nr:hypothetical protein H4582DRAFT_2073850 [Lactarius indigo]
MSEHTHVRKAPQNPTPHVASPSATEPPRDEIQCHGVYHHQMTREREVEPDMALGGHTPDGQDGCQRPTGSPPSYALSFGQAQASSCSSNIDVNYPDSGSNCPVGDVSDSQSTQSHPGSAADSDCCSGNTLGHVSQSGQLPRFNTGPTSDNTVNTIICGASHGELDKDRFANSEKAAELGGGRNRTLLLSIQEMSCPPCAQKVMTALLSIPSVQDIKVNTFTGQVSLTYKEGLIEPGKIAKRTTELTGYACVVDSARLEESHRKLRIALPTVSGSSTKVPKLPLGVEILDTSSYTSGTVLDVQYDPTIVAPRTVVDSFAAVGGSFLPPPKSIASLQASKEIYNLFIRTLISFILCIPVLVFAWAPIKPRPIVYGAISLFLATCIQICAGGPLYSMAFCSLFLQHTLDTDALVILSSTIAYLFSFIAYVVQVTGHKFNTPFFETPALLLTLISIGELIGLYARRRATSALDSLGTLQPDYVQLVSSDDSVTVIHADLTQSNDILRVSVNTLVPTDGIVIRAGTRNMTSSVDMKVVRVPAENTIAEISALVARLQEARLSIQDLADRAA